MTSMKDTTTVQDFTAFALNQTDLVRMKVGDMFQTQRRAVPRSDGLQWWLRCYPAGDTPLAKGYVGVFLWVNKPVKASYTIAVDGSMIGTKNTYEFINPPFGIGRYNFATHKALQPWFRDGKLNITCNIKFDVEVPFTLSVPRNFQLFDHIETDIEIVVGDERIQAHKNFISMISPVFNSMFSHNTAESKSNQFEITDFDYNTVKAAIDLCYGRDLEDPSFDTMVDILRFADKYFITAVTNQFEKLPSVNLSVNTFCAIVHYAYDYNNDALLSKCCNFFKNHQDQIKRQKNFADLPPALVVHVIKTAFNLETEYCVFRHAVKNNIASVIEYLERPFNQEITIENFCPAVAYAWECSRNDLKNRCAAFYSENLVQVMNLVDFHDLPSETIGDISKLSFILKQDTD